MTSPRAGAALITLSAMFGLFAVAYTLPVGDSLRHALDGSVYDAVIVGAGLVAAARGLLYPRDRLAWLALSAAVLSWGVADLVWTFTVADLPDPPYPWYPDIGYLAVYPAAYVGIVLLLRSRVRELRSSLWLDGVISGLAVAAVGTAIVLPVVLSTVGGSRAAVTTNIAYPLADLTLIGLVVWALASTGWRPDRVWGLLATGILVFSISDCLFLYQTAVGTYRTARRPISAGSRGAC